MPSTRKGAMVPPDGGSDPRGVGTQLSGPRRAQSGEEIQDGLGVQEWHDGSRYEGEFKYGLKHGKGRYTWSDGEYYEGSFYKDFRHGDGIHCWPTGHKFTGKFYLNRKEGWGHHLFPDGGTIQGLYHSDQRLGPSVITYPDGSQDVGLFDGNRLIRLCSSLDLSFSMKNFPEYAEYMVPALTTYSLSQPPTAGRQTEARTGARVKTFRRLQLEDKFILPPGIENYLIDGDHLPLPPGRRRVLDQLFFGELWEPDPSPYQGYERDPLSKLPLQARMEAHIDKFRKWADSVDWDVAAVLSLNRKGFGPKGRLETISEQLIRHASQGEVEAVSKILQTGLIHPDVADSQGNSALMAAAVHNQHDVIHLLLDVGVDIDKLNCEGISALAMCHVLHYPFQSLQTTFAETPNKTQVLRSLSSRGKHHTNSPRFKKRPLTSKTTLSIQTNLPDKIKEEASEQIVHPSSKLSNELKLTTKNWPGLSDNKHLKEEREQCQELLPEQNYHSYHSGSSHCIQVAEGAATSSRIGIPQPFDIHKMATMESERRARFNTLKLLLDRGSDPNVSRVPMPVLFFAIMAADIEAVRRLLHCGACPDIPLPPQRKGLYPLHVAAALPGPAGPSITELLLHTIPDADARAYDHNEIYGPDKTIREGQEPQSITESPNLNEGGRTALHVACQRDGDHQNVSKVVALLLSHRASTDLLWSGHSPLSLAIAVGNDLAVAELLKRGANPNLPLSHGVGSALCAVANINYHSSDNKAKLLKMLAKAGADIMMPVMVGDVVGTAVDRAHYSFNQDLCIANTPFHALNKHKRETLKARLRLLSMMGDLVRVAAGQRERDNFEREQQSGSGYTEGFVSTEAAAFSSNVMGLPPITDKYRKPEFLFCYQCGRSALVKLTACSRCHKVFYCSSSCRLKSWEQRHKKECVRQAEIADGIKQRVVVKSQICLQPLSAKVKSQTLPKLLSGTKGGLESQVNMMGNYSYV